MFHARPRGFTIMELMVCAAIIAVISLIVIANFRSYTQKSALENEAERLSSTLRQVNIHALTGMVVNGVRPYGFGIHFIKCTAACSYFIFADTNGNYLYDDGLDIITQRLGMLENDVLVGSFTPDNNYLDLVFSAPRGEVYINGNQSALEGVIFLNHKNSGFARRVKLDRFSASINIE